MPDWKHWSTEKVSSRVLYAIVGLTAMVFALFWFVGFNRPYDEDPNFNAPLFTDVLLLLLFLVVAGALFAAGWAVWRMLKTRGKGERMNNNIPAKKIGYIISGCVVALLLVTFLFGSSKPMTINGVAYTDAFWLKTSDMLVNTTLVMIVAAAAAVIYGSTKYRRRK
jgi:hypothetical protein